jgi:hypothetical protein
MGEENTFEPRKARILRMKEADKKEEENNKS